MPGVEGRVTMVTGAGRGIGRVAAGLLASRGARVIAFLASEESSGVNGEAITVALGGIC